MCQYLIKKLKEKRNISLDNADDLLHTIFDGWEELKDNCIEGWLILQRDGFVNIAGVEISKIEGYIIQIKGKRNILYDAPDGWENNIANCFVKYDEAKAKLKTLMANENNWDAEIKVLTTHAKNTTHKHITFVNRKCI